MNKYSWYFSLSIDFIYGAIYKNLINAIRALSFSVPLASYYQSLYQQSAEH